MKDVKRKKKKKTETTDRLRRQKGRKRESYMARRNNLTNMERKTRKKDENIKQRERKNK